MGKVAVQIALFVFGLWLAFSYFSNVRMTSLDNTINKRDEELPGIPKVIKTKTEVIRHRDALDRDAQIGWNQVEIILDALPEDGNLLVWGLGKDSPFWHGVTTGRVVFLEDGEMGKNLIDGRRWFDVMIEKFPHLEAYMVNYTTKNDEATFKMFYSHPEKWSQLELQDLPACVLKTPWHVILVDAPTGGSSSCPGRYQSIYMTKQIVETVKWSGRAIHVFIDDFDRKVENLFSLQVFGTEPNQIIVRPKTKWESNKQAHFILN